jgi:hypothetical protein
MLRINANPFSIDIKEACGIRHDLQTVEVDVPSHLPELTELTDANTGRRFLLQKSRRNARKGFLQVEVDAFEHLILEVSKSVCNIEQTTSCFCMKKDEEVAVIGNSLYELEVFIGSQSYSQPASAYQISGPIIRFRKKGGSWRGKSHFDLHERVISIQGTLVESGPIRMQYSYKVQFETGYYSAEVTVDAAQHFTKLSEVYHSIEGGQLVWEFSGDDLPSQLLVLDSTAGYETHALHFHIEQRMSRLSPWTQYSQLHDLADGYAVRFADEDEIVGFVTLQGGAWRGNRLNHMEAWTRRYPEGMPHLRRSIPWEAKADSMPNPISIPNRGKPIHAAHFTIESWLGKGKRTFALVITDFSTIQPLEQIQMGHDDYKGCSPALGHFEYVPDRKKYRLQQSYLRKIHTQYGMMPLDTILHIPFEWQNDNAINLSSTFGYAHSLVKRHITYKSNGMGPSETTEDRIQLLIQYLQARVFGFWEGGGSAYTNCVVSRMLTAEMLHFEWLVKEGLLTTEQIKTCRSLFIFLTNLFYSDHYYPGDTTMLPMESGDSTEPTLAGMANQNFYTDIINVFGMAAQVFSNHPDADKWRSKFIEMWHRQLNYHMVPESGVWEESHTYYHHVLHTVLPIFHRRKADGVDDEFANPLLHKLVGVLIAQLTPRNAHVRRIRHIVPFGDHEVNPFYYRYLYAAYADAIAPHHVSLAGKLMWAFRESGGDLKRDYPEGRELDIYTPEWTDEHLHGLAYFFRDSDGEGNESLLALRSGMTWGHHHNDEGSIQFFALGRSMIVDAACGMNPKGDHGKKYRADGHSRWSIEGLNPLNYWYRFNRGWISDSRTGELAYAVSYNPVYMHMSAQQQSVIMKQWVAHYRTVVKLTDKAYAIIDYADTSYTQNIRFHIPGRSVITENSSAWAEFDDGVRLHIAALNLNNNAPALNVDELERFTTTEVTFTSRSVYSLFLIQADVIGEQQATTMFKSGSYRLSHRDFDVDITLFDNGRVQFTNLRTQFTRTIQVNSYALNSSDIQKGCV